MTYPPQAAEKSLKAFQFTRDANQNFTHQLSALCTGLPADVVSWVKSLERIHPNPTAMRYPNPRVSSQIPHDAYDDATMQSTRDVVTNIFNWVRHIVNNK